MSKLLLAKYETRYLKIYSNLFKMSTKKIVRVKTKETMMIIDTPGTPFEKFFREIVGPLPVTEKLNEYILTIQNLLVSTHQQYHSLIPFQVP